MGRSSAGGGSGGGTGRVLAAPAQVSPQVAADVQAEVKNTLKKTKADEMTARDFSGKNITVVRDAGSKAELNEMFLKNVTDKELTKLVGAPNGAKVIVEKNPFASGVQIRVEHPWYDTQVRSININRAGEIVMNNDVFKASRQSPAGVGTRVFAIQAKAAKKLGIDKITMDAEGSPGSLMPNGRFPPGALNGYYVWARLGVNTRLNMIQQMLLPDNLRQPATLGRPVKDLNDLMIHGGKAGADWWKANGKSFEGTFDLRGNSRQMQALDLYLAENGIRVP